MSSKKIFGLDEESVKSLLKTYFGGLNEDILTGLVSLLRAFSSANPDVSFSDLLSGQVLHDMAKQLSSKERVDAASRCVSLSLDGVIKCPHCGYVGKVISFVDAKKLVGN